MCVHVGQILSFGMSDLYMLTFLVYSWKKHFLVAKNILQLFFVIFNYVL